MAGKLLAVISGPSGVGKTTVVRRLLELIPNSTRLVTTTTRPPRENEINGRDYWFLTREEFIAEAGKGHFIEWVESYGHFYGTSFPKLNELFGSHSTVFATLDTRGVFSLKERFPEAVTIFIRHGSLEELERRIRSRHTNPEDVRKRIAAVGEKMEHSRKFDHVVANNEGEFEKTISAIQRILKSN